MFLSACKHPLQLALCFPKEKNGRVTNYSSKDVYRCEGESYKGGFKIDGGNKSGVHVLMFSLKLLSVSTAGIQKS